MSARSTDTHGFKGAGLEAAYWRSPNPVLLIDDDRHFVDVNLSGCLLFRLPREEIVGRRVDDLTPPDLQSWMREEWQRILAAASRSGTFFIRMADGRHAGRAYRSATNVRPGVHAVVLFVTGESFASGHRDADAWQPVLTWREREVLSLIARGKTGDEIGEELSISGTTVQTHVRNAMRKLGAHTRAHAIARAIHGGEI